MWATAAPDCESAVGLGNLANDCKARLSVVQCEHQVGKVGIITAACVI
jgi:hypothetical protein